MLFFLRSIWLFGILQCKPGRLTKLDNRPLRCLLTHLKPQENSQLTLNILVERPCTKQLKTRLLWNKRISLGISIVSPEPRLQLFCTHNQNIESELFKYTFTSWHKKRTLKGLRDERKNKRKNIIYTLFEPRT